MNQFDDIRPYIDEEIPDAMRRIADSPYLPTVAHFLKPGMPVAEIQKMILANHTIKEFQQNFVYNIVTVILEKTTSGLHGSGFENIHPGIPYLFVSNHRDIVLDAMLLQYILNQEGHDTCQIAFGSNLMSIPFVIDFGKANKMFCIERGGAPKEFYNSMAHVSDYIRHVITEQKESVWIAQRNGRTKDGMDATDPAIIKMFGMSRRDDRVASLAELNIIPTTVSYEWESCDKLKTLELYHTRMEGHYEKQPNEDLNSVLTGIKQPKGQVSVHISPRVTEADLNGLNDCTTGEFYKRVAALIDQRINANYRLYANNYIAHDLRSGTTTYAEHYSAEQKAVFMDYLRWIDDYPDLDKALLREIFLGIYANPVDAKQ